jgi:hypothetical protein
MRRERSRIIAILALCLPLLSAPALADTLELKDGSILEGRYLGGTQTSVRFESKGQVKVIPLGDLLALTFSDRSGTSAGKQASASAPQSRSLQGLVVPAGTKLLVRTDEEVNSSKQKVGDRFTCHLEADLLVDGVLVAKAGTQVYGRLAEAKKGGRLVRKAELKLELTDIKIAGEMHPLVTEEYELAGEGQGTAKKVGAAAAVGAIADGSDGAKKGAAVGAGIALLTKGKQIEIPEQTLIEFRMAQPLTFN